MFCWFSVVHWVNHCLVVPLDFLLGAPCISSSPPSISYLCWSTCWCRPTLRLFSVSASAPASLHDFTVKNIDGEQVEHNIYCLDGQNAFCRWTLLCTREGPAWWSMWPASILRFWPQSPRKIFYELDFEYIWCSKVLTEIGCKIKGLTQRWGKTKVNYAQLETLYKQVWIRKSSASLQFPQHIG